MNFRFVTTRPAADYFATTVVGAGAALLVMRAPHIEVAQPLLLVALLAGSMVLSASKVSLPIVGGHATLSMSYFTDFLALVLVSPDEAMLVAGASGVTQCAIHSRGRPSWIQTLFNGALLMLTTQLTGLVAAGLGGFRTSSLFDLGTVTLASAAVFFVANSGLVAIVVALSKRQPVVRTWYREFFWTAPACFVGASSAALLVHVASAYVWAALLLAAPLYVTSRAYRLYVGRLAEQQRHVREVSDLHMASVEALARAIDARDQTIEHVRGGNNDIRRVQAWATALAEAAGMSDHEVQAVKVAALLYDIGKLAVPEHILTKPGRLTAKEFARVRIHPVVGAEIIKAVPFPYPVAAFIRSHHERWDGSGYPDGLRGEETPLGARVLALVDYFDALSSARPYHAAASRREAIDVLQSESGCALDPRLVALFLDILPTLESSLDEPSHAHGRPLSPDVDGPTVIDAPERSGPLAPAWVFHNISLATQEMRELYDIAQALGTRLSVDDTMALLTAKLGRLIPGSAWVLFLYDANDDVLRCQFATGLSANTISGMVIPSGGGLSGWAARQCTSVLNGRAAADFEAAGVSMMEPAFQSALSHPLADGDHLIGTLTIYHVERDAFSLEHRHLLEHVSGQVASVLRNSVAFERMREEFLNDPLTGLPNSRALSEFLQSSGQAAGDHMPRAFIMIDLDGFKMVNDGYGHPTGDAALAGVAGVIRDHVRDGDFCARYGGDEFVVVLPGCDRAAAESRAADLQDAVARLRLATPQGPLQLGISVGVSASPADGDTVPALIAVADRRMYLDKANRRRLDEASDGHAAGA